MDKYRGFSYCISLALLLCLCAMYGCGGGDGAVPDPSGRETVDSGPAPEEPQNLLGRVSYIGSSYISLDGKVYNITSEKKGEEHLYYYQGEEVDLSDFQNAMSKLKAEEFTDERPAGKEEMGLTIYLDKEQHPQVLVELHRYDGDQCLAVVDGEPLALVDRAAVVELVESVYQIVLG